MRLADFVCEHEVAERRAEATEPRERAERDDRGERLEQRDETGAERGQEVAAGSPRALLLDAVANGSACELR